MLDIHAFGGLSFSFVAHGRASSRTAEQYPVRKVLCPSDPLGDMVCLAIQASARTEPPVILGLGSNRIQEEGLS